MRRNCYMNQIRPRIHLIVEEGRIWEAYSDSPVELLISDVDKQWVRHINTTINSKHIDNIAALVHDLEKYNVVLPGLIEEIQRHVKKKV